MIKNKRPVKVLMVNSLQIKACLTPADLLQDWKPHFPGIHDKGLGCGPSNQKWVPHLEAFLDKGSPMERQTPGDQKPED